MKTEGDTWTSGKLVLAGASLGLAGASWMAARRAARRARARLLPPGSSIVILGGGFAGVHVARELLRLLPEETDGRITLVNETDYLLFTPMLTEVAGGQLNPAHVVSPLRRLAPRLAFLQARVEGIDAKTRTVHLCEPPLDDTIPARRYALQADHLVIALGSVTNYRNIPGLKENSFTMKDLGDAAALCDRVLALLERAAEEPDAEKRKALLGIVVGGGGFSGVETMAAVNEFVRDAAKNYPRIKQGEIRTVLIHAEKRLLPELNEGLAAYAQSELERRGVEVVLNTEIAGAGPDHVQEKGGRRIPTHTIIWTGGVEPNPVVQAMNVPHGHHKGIIVDACCAVPDHSGVWALGDCAEIPKPDGKGDYAPIAQNATREGTCVAENVVASLSGGTPKPFVYRPVGQMALVGRRAGVASLWGLRFSGFAAWALWRAVYLAKMPSPRRRIRITMDWLLDLVFGHDIVELPGPDQPGHHPAFS